MQTSHDEDSCEYSVDDFSSQCDQLESIHEESESNTTRKCSSSDIEILVDEYSVDDNFDSPKKEDQDNSTDEAEHATPPVSDNSTQSRVYPSEGHCHSHAQTAKEEHEDEYIGDIDVTPLEANTTLVRSDVKLICQEGTISDATLVCPDAESNDQEEIARTLSKVSLHHDHMPNTKRTVSLVPRCAYAETKSMKYKKEGGLQSAEQKSAKVSCYSLERLTELSKPVEHRSYHSDNENDHKTTIKPKKTSLDSSESRSSFLERMESKEEERREKLQLAIARAVYDAKVDKDVCPNCGHTQSFQEMTKGKMECSNDGCRNEKHCYGPPRHFKLRSFEERMKRSALRRSLILSRIEEERKSKILSTCQKTSRHQQELREMASVEDFNTRMANDIRDRKEKIANLEQTARAMLEKEHSFKPKLHVAESLIKHRRGGLDRLSQPSRRYTEEYQPPYDEVEKMKKKYRKKPLESPTQIKQTTKTLDEDKLKQKFQKMIM